MDKLKILLFSSLALAFLQSCIRDRIPECPPMCIELQVEDKNYFNIDDAVYLGLAEKKDENLPFREYISTLYYIVHDSEGNVVAERKNSPVENDELKQYIVLPSELPYGNYSISVWGNMQSEEPLENNASAADLEAVGAAKNDIYLASAEFIYSYGSERYTLGMQRAKGNLMIKAEGIPDYIDYSVKNIRNIYSVLTSDFSYGQTTDVRTELQWPVRNTIVSQTLLCPSPGYEATSLEVIFLDSSSVQRKSEDTSVIYPEEVNITMSRNNITIMRYLYDSLSGEFEISVYMDDRWVVIHDMGIE